MAETLFSIKAAARKTGLTPHVIRVWERRYGAVKPARSGSNRRLYSEGELDRLALLRQATRLGHGIGTVAGLPEAALRKLTADPAAKQAGAKEPESEPEKLIAGCLQAIRGLSAKQMEELLVQASLAFGQHGLLAKVIGPLVQQIGDLWRSGALMAAHEHFASAAIRDFLGRTSRPFAHDSGAPTIVVGTPSGQLHELGAVMVAAAASDLGWRVVYLGPSLPAAEIAGVALQNRALAVALSIVYPEDDTALPGELESLRRYLGEQPAIIVGGRAAESYVGVLESIRAVRPDAFKDLYDTLESLRAKQRSHPPARA